MRVKSNAVWHSLPGVVAAYQPIVAPGPFAARQNVAHSGARFGVYTAVPGVAPTWNAATGLTFNGTDQYLKIGCVPPAGGTLIVRFSGGVTDGSVRDVAGAVNVSGGVKRFYVCSSMTFSSSARHEYGTGSSATNAVGYLAIVPALASGVIAIAGASCYLNGVNEGTNSGGSSGSTLPCYLGAVNYDSNAYGFFSGSIQAALFSSRTLSPAEMWLASRQMAYCEQNPDWNAWARRRQYYYAPPAAAAAFNPAWARNTNTLLGGGFD